MSIDQTSVPTPRKPLRLWSGVGAAAMLVLVRFGPLPGTAGMMGPIGSSAGWWARCSSLWWRFFSLAPGPSGWAPCRDDRRAFATRPLLHASSRAE